MPEGVYHQAAFIAGEWSPLAQGRSDLPAYKTAMNVCVNGIPVFQGAWVRRSGTFYLGPTIDREYSKLAKFVTDGAYSLMAEFGSLKLRFFQGYNRVTTSDDRTVTASSSSSGVVSMTLDAAHGWSVGDTVYLVLPSVPAADAGLYLNRLMTIATAPASDQLTLTDDLGIDFTFDGGSGALVGCTVKRLLEFVAPWTGVSVLRAIRTVQASDKLVVLTKTVFPQSLTITDNGGVPTFGSLADYGFQDGPYLESQQTAPDVDETGTVSAYTGSITFTPAASTFTASDVGRHIRLFHQPAQWNSGTTYSYGDLATYNDEWWTSIAADTYATANINVVPGTLATISGTSVVLWAAAPQAGRWAWGKITAQAGTSCTVSLETDLSSVNGTTITEWRLGVYTTGQYPTCGTYADGRLFLAGAVPNRIDASKANNDTSFAPTDEFGNVEDDNAFGGVLNFDEQQTIYWMAPDKNGIIIGTLGGELMLTSESGLTPFDRETKKVTRYSSADAEACRAGDAVLFLQYHNRAIVEFRPNDFGTRFFGEYLNEYCQHLTVDLLHEIAYQQTPVSILWCRDRQGKLSGITYRRTSTDLVNAGHRHEIALDVKRVASVCVATVGSWFGEALFMVTSDVAPSSHDVIEDGGDYAIEMMMPILPEL